MDIKQKQFAWWYVDNETKCDVAFSTLHKVDTMPESDVQTTLHSIDTTVF